MSVGIIIVFYVLILVLTFSINYLFCELLYDRPLKSIIFSRLQRLYSLKYKYNNECLRLENKKYSDKIKEHSKNSDIEKLLIKLDKINKEIEKYKNLLGEV